MAIDPGLLAALTSGASTGSKISSSTGIDWGAAKKNQAGAWNLGQSIIDILSTGGYATAGITRKVGENVAAVQRGEIGGLLDLVNPLSVIPAAAKGVQERRTYSQNLKDLGVEDKTATWLGLALDIGLDPTTYITGGTIAGVKGTAAGVRLAKAANKANAKVAESAAEAAANNLPDLTRPFIPVDAPLTQGQKLGNYLTGILRGYEFNKSAYAAERAGRNLAKAVQKDAKKSGDKAFADEALSSLETYRKSTNASIADDVAVLRRDEFMQAVAQSPALQAKFTGKLAKAQAKAAKAKDLEFFDAKVAAKDSEKRLAEAAQASQAQKAMDLGTESATLSDEALAVQKPAIQEIVENEAVIANRAAAEKAASKARKAYETNLKSVRTKYGNIVNEALDFIARTTDPATGKKLSETLGDVDNPLEVVADLLATGKLKPSANRTARFARALGVSSDPQQSVVDLTAKTLLKAQGAVNKVEELQQTALQLSRALDGAFINATTENGAAAGGMVNPAKVADEVENALDLEQEIPNRVNDVISDEFLDTPSTGAKTADEMAEAEQTLRALPQEQIAEDLAFIRSSKFKSPEFNMVNIARDFMESGPYDQIVRLAARLEKSVDEVLDDFMDGDVNVINDPAFKLSRDAVRLDIINPEGRISTYNKLTNAVRANQGKSGRTAVDSVEEEGRLLRNFENFWRLMGVPVKTRENILMQLRRDGQKFVGDKLSANFKPMDIDFTTADLDIMAVQKGAGEIMAALRYPGKTYQNVLPTNFEYAVLTLARYKELGADLTKGSEAWNEIRKTFDEVYSFPEGTIPKKAPVDDFFKPAPHLNPTTIINGKKLKKIPNLDQKTDAVIQFMIDNADEILDISAARAAARYARAVNETLPTATDIISDMIRYVSVRENFAANIVRLAQVPPVPGSGRFPLEVGAKGIAGLSQVKFNLKSLILNTAKNAKVFTDPELAKEVSDMMLNMFMKSLIGGTAKGPLDEVAPITRKRITDFVIQHMSELRKEIATEIDLFDAIGGSKPKIKVTPKTAAKAKEARRKQVETKGAEAASLVPAAVKATDDVVEAASKAAETAPPIGDEASNIPTNHAAGNVDPIQAGLENIATTEIKALTDLNFSQNWLLKFSGRYGMGLATKVVIGGVEYFNQSKVGFFNNGLRQILVNNNRDLAAINKAFKLVQEYGREMIKRVDTDQAEIPFTEWAQTAKTDDVNMEIAESFSDAIAAMFGVDGVLTTSINQPFFADELNKMFDMRGFFDIGEGAFRLADDAGPMAIKYSWAAANVEDVAEGKKGFDALTFLSNYASAMHAVQTRIGIGESFSSFFGKTLAQIKEEGLDSKNFVKIDPEDEFAKYLNPEKLYDASELERLRYVKEYVLYPKSFSSKTMQTVVDLSDRITSVLKSAHTTWRPGHHVTSIIGEALMNTFAGVNSPKYYANSIEILRAFDPSIYKGDPNLFKSYAEVGAPRGMQVKGTEFDTVGYVNSATGKRTVVSAEAVAYAAERLGILTRGGASTVEDLDLRGMADFGTGVVGGVSRINSKLANFSSHRDNIFRMAHFVKEIEKGGVFKSFEEAAIHAAKQVTTYHPTIGGLSAFERKVMRRAVFFYTWQRIAATKVFELLLEQPGKVTIPSKIQYAFAEANGFNPESFGDPWDPDGVYASWHTGSLYGPQFQGPAGKGDAWGFGPAVPQLDIMNSLFGGFTVQPGESALDVLTRGSQNLAGQNLSPLPKWFAELSTGNRVGTGGNINNLTEYAIDQVGGLNTLSKLTGIGQEPETGLTPSEQGEKKARLLANWFLGQKLQDYSTSQTIKQWRSDQRRMMERLTGQE